MNRGKTPHIGNLHVSSLIVYQTELNVENYEYDTLHHAAMANDLLGFLQVWVLFQNSCHQALVAGISQSSSLTYELLSPNCHEP